MPRSISIDLSQGEHLFDRVPEIAAEARQSVRGRTPRSVWVDDARDVLGPAAEVLALCDSREESWLVTAVMDALGPFHRAHVGKSFGGERLRSWSARLTATSRPGALTTLVVQEPIKEAGSRGMPPILDIYVEVFVRYPRLRAALRRARAARGATARAVHPDMSTMALAIEYDGGAHRRDPDADKRRDARVFRHRRAPTLRLSGADTKRDGGWKQFRDQARSVHAWVAAVTDHAAAVDAEVSEVLAAHEDDRVAYAALVESAYLDLAQGRTDDALNTLGALRRVTHWPVSPGLVEHRLERQITAEANRRLRILASDVPDWPTGAPPLGSTDASTRASS